MPAKKMNITDAERAKRIRETAREIGTSDDPKAFERAFERVVRPKPEFPSDPEKNINDKASL
jgi:hypothetical protein